MARASLSRVWRTVCLTDIFVLALITWGAAAGSASLGNRTNLTVIMFTMAWMAAAVTRLSDFRKGRQPAVRLELGDMRTIAILLAGTAPWLLSEFVQSAYPDSPLWTPFEVPPLLRALGVALALLSIGEPFFRAIASPRRADAIADHRFSTVVFVRSAAIVLISGSPVFSIFCGLWLAVALSPSPGRFRFAISSSSAETLAG